GKSVVCITHNVDNLDECNLILVLARGKLVYYGPPAEARPYFRVSRLSEVYDRLAEEDPQAWSQDFAACSLHRELGGQRLETPHPSGIVLTAPAVEEDAGPSRALAALNGPVRPARRFPRPQLWHQFCVLATRYTELIWGDPRSLRLLLLQG